MNERNVRLLIAYDGTCYSGWQRQQNAPTVQETLENCLRIMLGSPVTLHGAGRTDAGVHALGMVANFPTFSNIPCSGFTKGLNSMLPEDIRILATSDAEAGFHSRYNAVGKSYRYDIFTGAIQLPTSRLYCAHFPGRLNMDKIKICLKQILGTHDFSSFEGTGSREENRPNSRGAVRTLFHTECILHPDTSDEWSFFFTGNGFLRHMIRNLVGTLVAVGREKITPAEFLEIMLKRDRSAAGPTAPARGLILEKIYYDQIPVNMQ